MSRTPVGIFCDFDGTISERDIIVSIGLEFGGPAAPGIIERVQSRELTVREGVAAMVGQIPSSRFPDVVAYATDRILVRDGFYDFVDEVLRRHWFFAVVSGGFDFFVDPVVERFGSRVQVFRNHIDASGPFLRVEWAVPCDDACDGGCGLCKPTVLRQFRSAMSAQVVIGDGVTDVKAARLADYVFARDGLQLACEREGMRYAPFHTFVGMADVIQMAVE